LFADAPLAERPRKRDWFFDFCQENGDWQFERTAEGEILAIAPAGVESGYREGSVHIQLDAWARRNKSGVAFNNDVGFDLPNGATRAPDASWIKKSRLAKLTPEQRQRFSPIVPDFLIEVRSPSDRLPTLLKKMEEYLANGVRLGWLIDPQERTVRIYRPGKPVQCLKHPRTVAGSPELPKFTLKLAEIWEPGF